MAPLGISLVNLLIESSSLSCLTAQSRQGKNGQEFSQNSSSLSSSDCNGTKPSSSTAPSTLVLGNGESTSSTSNVSSATGKGTFSSSSTTITTTPSPSSYEGSKFSNNNNNYFSGTSQGEKKGGNNFEVASPSSTPAAAATSSASTSQKLYTLFWEKFKKSGDLDEPSTFSPFRELLENGTHIKNKGNDESKSELNLKNKAEPVVRPDKGSSAGISYENFYERILHLHSKFLPFTSVLIYPSDLHYYGRLAVMTVVTGLVIEKTLESLPGIEQLGDRYGPLFRCNVLDGSNPNQPGRVGLDKDFF